jgi:heat shock protein HtpX
MPALFGIIVALCRRAGIGQVPSLYFLPSGVPTAFATGVGDQSVIVISSGLLRLLMTRELTGVLAHEITHIAKHDVELMQLAGIVGQMTRVIAQVAIIIHSVFPFSLITIVAFSPKSRSAGTFLSSRKRSLV